LTKEVQTRFWSIVVALVAACGPLAASSDATFELRGVVRSGSDPAAHAAVWLVGTEGFAASRPAKVVLDQRNLSFRPHLLVVQVGTTVALPNNDRVLHNVFSFRDGRRFDLGLYPVGTVRHVTFDRAGLSRLFCNIHPNMAAYVLAVDTPHFAVSGSDGRFSIAPVASGSYTYHAWRPGAEELTGSVEIDERTTLEIGWR
jgi:plastocyanin